MKLSTVFTVTLGIWAGSYIAEFFGFGVSAFPEHSLVALAIAYIAEKRW